MHLGWLIGVALLLYGPAVAQTPLVRVHHVENEDGKVYIVAENKGVAVVTVYLSAELVNMTSEPTLPTKFALFPTQGPQILATLTHRIGVPFSYQYRAPAYLGLYSSRRSDTTQATYHFPFSPDTPWNWGLFDKRTGQPQFAIHSYVFALADHTPVRAARAGVVANIRQDRKLNSSREANGIEVLHDDGTYACYLNIASQSARVGLGQRVNAGDQLAEYRDDKLHLPLWFFVQRLGEKGPENIPAHFEKASQMPPH